MSPLNLITPKRKKKRRIVSREGNIETETATRLVTLAEKIRNIREHGLAEGASTRLLIYAARLIKRGMSLHEACKTAICLPLTDDETLQETLNDLIEDIF